MRREHEQQVLGTTKFFKDCTRRKPERTTGFVIGPKFGAIRAVRVLAEFFGLGSA